VRNVRNLTEGAILLAAFTVLLLVTIYIPVIGSVLNLVLPLPFIIFTFKNSIKMTLAFFVAALLITFITGSVLGISIMLPYGIAGVVMGYLIRLNKSRSVILIASSLVFLASLVISYVISAVFFNIDFVHELSTMVNQSLKSSQEMLKAMGNEGQIKQLKEQYGNMLKLIKTIAPTALIMSSIFLAFITQVICFPIAKRFGVNVQPMGKLMNFTLPKSLLWYFLAAMAANIFIHPAEGTYLYLVLVNAVYILQMFMFLQGIALLFYFLYQKSIAKGLGILIVILAFMIPIIHYIILILGITDLGFDFRKRF
jgi:uncharacterized protein YybS (DUF2232 family)